MTKVSYVLQGDNLIVVVDSHTHAVDPSHPNYSKIIEAVKEADFDNLADLINMTRVIEDFSQGLFEVTNGQVFYDGNPIHSALQDRMLDMIEQDFDVDPLINFIANLMENPSNQAVDQLYGFLEKNLLPLTSDGHFLAYKSVREDYKDRHTGTFNNSIGSVCEMPRNTVQDNPNVTCSNGLHFCSLDYLNGFYGAGGHVMVVKINPRDVVSIPTDYNESKGRCCRYEVVGEHNVGSDRQIEEAFDKPVYSGGAKINATDEHGNVEFQFTDVEAGAKYFDIPASYIKRVLSGDRNSTAGHGWEYA